MKSLTKNLLNSITNYYENILSLKCSLNKIQNT